jgi:hypothetical protein
MAKASALGPAGAVIDGIAGALGDLQKTLEGLAASVVQFVQALAPGIVMEFQQALKDVQATIGSAFTGAVSVFASVAREIGGILLPAMQQLKPIVDTLANAVGTQLTAVVRIVVSLFQAFAPVLQVIADGLNQLSKLVSDVVGVFTALVKTFTTMLTTLLGSDTGGFREAFKGLADIVRQVVKAMVSLYATLSSFFGEDTRRGLRLFADSLDKEAKDREDRANGLRAAATNAQVTDVQSIVKQAQLAAFTAAGTGGVREKTDNEFLREIAGDVRRAADSRSTIKEALESWWENSVMKGVFGRAIEFVAKVVEKIANSRLFAG